MIIKKSFWIIIFIFQILLLLRYSTLEIQIVQQYEMASVHIATLNG